MSAPVPQPDPRQPQVPSPEPFGAPQGAPGYPSATSAPSSAGYPPPGAPDGTPPVGPRVDLPPPPSAGYPVTVPGQGFPAPTHGPGTAGGTGPGAGQPTAEVAAYRLADRGWRWRSSLWVLWPVVTLGLLGFVGYLMVAFRMRTPRAWGVASIVTVCTAVGYVLAEIGNQSGGFWSDLSGFVLFAVWVGTSGYAFWHNRYYLRWRAGTEPWYAQAG